MGGIEGQIWRGDGGGDPNIIPIAGTFCTAYLANGITLTGATSIGLRIECTNPDGTKTAYVKVVDGDNDDLANFDEITQF